MNDMQQLTELEIAVFQLRMGFAPADRCVDWAVERLRLDQEGDDLEVVLLASARGIDEVLPLADVIIERYRGAQRLDQQFWLVNTSSSCAPLIWRGVKACGRSTPS